MYQKEIYKSDYGWGYKIYSDNLLVIVQPFRPAVSGYRGFESEDEASKCADLLIEKMKIGLSAAVTAEQILNIKELDIQQEILKENQIITRNIEKKRGSHV